MNVNEIATLLALHHSNDWKSLGNVNVIEKGDLLLFNYTNKAIYEGGWNQFELVSRGLIINRVTGEIVARPFDKFFNWGEGGRMTDVPIHTVTEKIDGSLGILYRLEGQYRIATRGSFDSDQAIWATEFLNKHHDLTSLADNWTLLFEIVYPANRVVVDYGDDQKLVLLTMRDRFDGQYASWIETKLVADYYGFETPRMFTFNSVDEILAALKVITANHEGWVVEFADGQRFKFKGEEYLKLHRLISGLSFKSVLEAVASGNFSSYLAQMPEEFRPTMEKYSEEINTRADQVFFEVRAIFAEAPKSTRKEFALWVMANHKPYSTYLFALLDGQEITPLIYKLAFDKPESLASDETER